MSTISRFKEANSLTAFLILECLAITSFALGGVNFVFYIVGTLVAIFAILTTIDKFSKQEKMSLLIYLGTMCVLSIFLSFGKLLLGSYSFGNILVFLAINAFLLLGLCSRKIEGFKTETMVLVIGFSIAVLVFISMFYSWIQYGFFYAEIYKDSPIYYYNANLFDITKEGGFFIGLNFKEVSLSYSGIFGLILSCYLLPLFYIKPKQETRRFCMYAAIGALGVIYLITIPNLIALAFLIPVVAIGLIYKYLRKNELFMKIVRYSIYTLSALIFVFFICVLISISGNNGFSNYIESNYILNRIFNNNGWMHYINIVLEKAILPQNFFGFNTLVLNSEAITTNTKMFEIELIKEGGIFAVLVLIALIVLSYLSLRKYAKESNDENTHKILFISIIIVFFLYNTFNYNSFPFIHDQTNYVAMFRSPLTLVMLFLLGYVFTSFIGVNKKVVDDKRENEKEMTETIDL